MYKQYLCAAPETGCDLLLQHGIVDGFAIALLIHVHHV
jgi:hypothetical protein